MKALYAALDDKGNVCGNLIGTDNLTLPMTIGESKLVTVYLLKPNGQPLSIPGTISTAVVKCFVSNSQASIQKTLLATQVTLITQGGVSVGTIGFQFQLSASDTANLSVNNSGLPMTATLTDSSGNVWELDFQAFFSVEAAAVLT